MMDQMLEALASYLNKGSGWRLKEINLEVKIYENKPLRGSSYVDLPKFIKDKKAMINIKNTDNECFKWALGNIESSISC
jgi:hypothetical protein